MTGYLPASERDPTDRPGGGTGDGKRPYQDGPVEIIPGLFIGCEENVRDWRSLTTKWGVGRVVNVAKELTDILDHALEEDKDEEEDAPSNSKEDNTLGESTSNGWHPPALARPLRRNTVSTPNLKEPPSLSLPSSTTTSTSHTTNGLTITEKTYQLRNGKTLEYLHLPWSHGQADLVSGAGAEEKYGGAGLIRGGDWVTEGLDRQVGVLVQ